jgi:LmbE family N-acetylglucosaminyl deacetylase
MSASIVFVGAHQDDELGCLGTLIRYAARGDRITTVSISNGDKGGLHDPTIPHSEIVRIRIDEASRVAAELGGEYVCVGQEDGFIQDDHAARMAVVSILRRVLADVVITLPPTDYTTDHVVAGRIAEHAALLAAATTIDTDEPALERTPSVMYVDTIAGHDFQPTHYVDISSEFARKVELLRLHESQMQSLPNITGWDLVTHAEAVGRFRGQQCGVRYAEGFRPALRVPLLRPGWVLP